MIHDFTVTTFNVKIVYFTNYSPRKKGDGWGVNIGGTVTGQGPRLTFVQQRRE
jgi:hypothetical protein